MKKTLLLLGLVLTMLATACGPSKEEQERQKRIEDSLASIDSDSTADNADALLREADSLYKLKQDSIKAAEEKANNKGGKK